MHFQIAKRRETILAEGYQHGKEVTRFTWAYRQGSPENPGEALFQGPAVYMSETAAREDINRVRQSASAIKFSKVVSPPDA